MKKLCRFFSVLSFHPWPQVLCRLSTHVLPPADPPPTPPCPCRPCIARLTLSPIQLTSCSYCYCLCPNPPSSNPQMESINVLVRVRPESLPPPPPSYASTFTSPPPLPPLPPSSCISTSPTSSTITITGATISSATPHKHPPSSSLFSPPSTTLPPPRTPSRTPHKPKLNTHTFPFDAVLSPQTTQAQVYAQVRPLVESTVNGYHTTVFAYGCTGSGKTHTIMGERDDKGTSIERNKQPRPLFEHCMTRWLTHVCAKGYSLVL